MKAVIAIEYRNQVSKKSKPKSDTDIRFGKEIKTTARYGFSGTYVAPKSCLTMAQCEKDYKGNYIAKSIVVHQDAVVMHGATSPF